MPKDLTGINRLEAVQQAGPRLPPGFYRHKALQGLEHERQELEALLDQAGLPRDIPTPIMDELHYQIEASVQAWHAAQDGGPRGLEERWLQVLHDHGHPGRATRAFYEWGRHTLPLYGKDAGATSVAQAYWNVVNDLDGYDLDTRWEEVQRQLGQAEESRAIPPPRSNQERRGHTSLSVTTDTMLCRHGF